MTDNSEVTTKNSLFFTPITPKEVTTVIRSLKSEKMILALNFSNIINTLILFPYISNLFNSCVEQGEFPDAIKMVEVPIYKKGAPNPRTNY